MATLYVRDGDLLFPKRQALKMCWIALRRSLHSVFAPVHRSCRPLIARARFLPFKAQERCDHEVFSVLFLDNRHRLIEYVELFRGGIDSASVHPREVVKEALARQCRGLNSGPRPPLRAWHLRLMRMSKITPAPESCARVG